MKRVGSREVWSVAEVVRAIWRRFQDPPIRACWLEAEICNMSRRGNQVYFTLRDGDAIEASMNAIVFDRLPAPPMDGTLVHAYGLVEFWMARSQVRIRVERLEPVGEGLLLARIEEVKRRLQGEGLMSDARKRPLPLLPRRIGLVTSAEGAARQDVLRNLFARFPPAAVLCVDARVQGDLAPGEIVRALRRLDREPDVDVIVLARGGGALEDLMAFNDEAVCRAVAASGTPVVSAVGHEKDVTVCDLVADRRVSTPSAAAEAVVPDVAAIEARLEEAAGRLARALRRAHGGAAERTAAARRHLARALRERGERAAQRVDHLAARLRGAADRAARRAPAELDARRTALERAAADGLARATTRVEGAGAVLAALSPARTVARGYAIVRDAADGRVVSSVADAPADGRLALEMRDGRLAARVEGVVPDAEGAAA